MILTSLGVESAHWPFWMGLMKRFRNSPSEPSRFFLMKLTMQWSVRIKFAVSIWEGSIQNQIKFTPACQNCFSFSIQKKEEFYTGDSSWRKDWRMKKKHVFFIFSSRVGSFKYSKCCNAAEPPGTQPVKSLTVWQHDCSWQRGRTLNQVVLQRRACQHHSSSGFNSIHSFGNIWRFIAQDVPFVAHHKVWAWKQRKRRNNKNRQWLKQ